MSALTHDTGSVALISRRGVSVLLMHMRGEPQTMQRDPAYDFPLIEVLEFLKGRIEACIAAGIPREQIAIDPGIGLGKLVSHNLELLSEIASFNTLGCGIVLGVSRKSTIARLSKGEPPRRACPVRSRPRYPRFSRAFKSCGSTMSRTRQALAVWRAIAES